MHSKKRGRERDLAIHTNMHTTLKENKEKQKTADA